VIYGIAAGVVVVWAGIRSRGLRAIAGEITVSWFWIHVRGARHVVRLQKRVRPIGG